MDSAAKCSLQHDFLNHRCRLAGSKPQGSFQRWNLVKSLLTATFDKSFYPIAEFQPDRLEKKEIEAKTNEAVSNRVYEFWVEDF